MCLKFQLARTSTLAQFASATCLASARFAPYDGSLRVVRVEILLSVSRADMMTSAHIGDPAAPPMEISTATINMRSAELTGAGESVRVRQEGKVNHYFHREPCGRTREGAFEASAAARVAGMMEQRKRYGPECRGFLIGRRQYLRNRHGEGLPGSALSEESRDARTPLAGTREGFDSPWQSCRGRGRK